MGIFWALATVLTGLRPERKNGHAKRAAQAAVIVVVETKDHVAQRLGDLDRVLDEIVRVK